MCRTARHRPCGNTGRGWAGGLSMLGDPREGTHHMPTRHVRDTGARFASQLTGWLRDRAQAMREVVDALRDLNRRVTKLEERMASLQEIIAEIDTATSDIAAELDTLRGRVVNGDAAAAEQLAPIAERLRAMATDPNNPVPIPAPDTGGTV